MADMSAADSAKIQKLIDDTRKRLVETGTRNRLIHVNRANTRGNVVNVVNEQSDDVAGILKAGKAMRFKALGQDQAEAGDLNLALDEGDFDSDRYSDNFLETRMGPDSLAKRLLKIWQEARTAEEEQGINILYLALGFVTWFEDKNSSIPREAPLVLLPVRLERNQKTSTFDLKLRDDDMVTNLPLQQRWQDDFGIKLPEIEALDDDWELVDYFELVEEAIANRPGWKIDRDAIQLGFFSFAKILMYRDLALKAWPEGSALEGHEMMRGLLYEGYGREEPMFGAEDRLDVVLPPEKILHVVDADASQAKVIEEVRAGRNLVVQGPPGTGKSQTITNILATAAWEGKTVLFVAEKMAALSVVHDRLVKVGLRDLTLELHSKTANKKAVLAELARTLAAGQAVPEMPVEPIDLLAARDRLNADTQLLHIPLGKSGETPFSLLASQARFLGAGAPTPQFTSERLTQMTRAELVSACAALSDYGATLERIGRPADHPLAAVRRIDVQPVALARISADIANAAANARQLHAALDAPLSAAGLDTPRAAAEADTVDDLLVRLEGLAPADIEVARSLASCSDPTRLASALQIAMEWKAAFDAASEWFVELAFQSDVLPLRAPIVAGTDSFFARLGSAYRSSSRSLHGMLKAPLPKSAAERLDLIDQLAGVQSLRRRWAQDEQFLAGSLGNSWRGEATPFDQLSRVADWCANAAAGAYSPAPALLINIAAQPARLSEMRTALACAKDAAATTPAAFEPLDLAPDVLAKIQGSGDFQDVAGIADRLAQGLDRYGEWTGILRLQAELRLFGLGDLLERMDSGELNGDRASTELTFARAEALWTLAVQEHPRLAELGTSDRHGFVQEFVQLERDHFKDNVKAIRSSHLDQLPQGAQGEMAVVRGELGKKRRHMAVRQLFAKAGSALQRIKPVMLMSPISVAQYLTPGQHKFDLLVIDEASQVRPEDALGAIARASQIVVVGDQKQLPPSSFFDRLLADGEGADEDQNDDGEDLLNGAASVGEMESILTLCEARGLPSRMLKWHYRSRDPSLMRVSNAEFYEHGLVLPPSPLEKDPGYGLIFTRVDGVYDKGGRRDNRIEGEAIVRRVAEHARGTPDLSLGIVTFSHAQKNTVNELLEVARRTDSALDEFLREGRSEDLFVKNIENVQGDERDVILVSVGYGPTTAGGRMIGASFGPVNGDGGERRLNVLFTRARLRCEVFASFDPGDLDVSRASRDGPRILKRYLDYAKSGQIDDPNPTGAEADSPLEEDVADVIRSLGYLADPQVGSAGFRIDMGVRHPDEPGTYLLAVECDGAAYHSALWARERDRLRQDVLEHLGWRFHRIWSTDWFYNRAGEIERLKGALAKARDARGVVSKIAGANEARAAQAPHALEPALTEFHLPEVKVRAMPAYARAEVHVSVTYEPHEAPIGVLAPLVTQIIEIEGPMHIEEVARRVAASFGKKSAGSRIVAATTKALRHARQTNAELRNHDEFWFTRAQEREPPVRDRSNEAGATVKADALSLLEIRAALRLAEEDNPGSTPEDLIRNAARLMGFQRLGPDLRDRIEQGLSLRCASQA